MTSDLLRFAGRPSINWRTAECWGAGVALFLQTGAVFPLLLAEVDGTLSDAAKTLLRLLCLPAYAFAALILLQNIPQLVIALRRNLLFPLVLALPFLSVLWSVSPSTSLRRAVGLLFTVLFAYALAIRFTPRQLLLIVFASFGTCVFLSAVLLVAAPNLAHMPFDSGIRGIFLHKNSLGWYACVSLLLSTALLMDGTPELRRTTVILWATGSVCVLVSGSMTAVISAISACGLFAFYSLLPRARGAARIVVILIVLQLSAGLLLWLHAYLVPFLEALGKDATLTGRVPLWEMVDSQIASHLLLGFGYQAFWNDANGEAWAIWSQIRWQAPHAHNGYRDTLLSFGMGGAILFTLVVVRALHQGAALHCRDPKFGWLWLNVFTVVFLVMNMTESMFLIQNDALFIVFATGIIMVSLYAPVRSSGGDLLAQTRARRATMLQTP